MTPDDDLLDANTNAVTDAEYVARLIARAAGWRGKRARQAQQSFVLEVLHQVFQKQLRNLDKLRNWYEDDPDIGKWPPGTDDPPNSDWDPDIPF